VQHWRRLLAHGGEGKENLPYHIGEVVLVVAIGCMVIGLLAWLVFALDGVRSVSPAARSGSVANRLALALLVSLMVLFASFRPTVIARELDWGAVQLQRNGLRAIPLALYEFASILDRGAPIYLVRAATLYDEVGLSEKADARRDLLRKRARQFAVAIGAELIPDATSGPVLPEANHFVDTIGPEPPSDQCWMLPSLGIQYPRP
jgi:hypothetical protein